MGLRLKFNLALLFVFVLGFVVSGYLSYNLLHKNAREEVLRNAGVMMEAALSMRQYTVSQVRDKLVQKEGEFLPQTVPAFAATEMMNQLRKKYPDYAYKEAALNPTNPRDRAEGWEADVVNQFRKEAGRPEISGTRGNGHALRARQRLRLAAERSHRRPAGLGADVPAGPERESRLPNVHGFARRRFPRAVHHPEPDALCAHRAAGEASLRRGGPAEHRQDQQRRQGRPGTARVGQGRIRGIGAVLQPHAPQSGRYDQGDG